VLSNGCASCKKPSTSVYGPGSNRILPSLEQVSTENTRGINSPSTPTLNPLYSIVLVPLLVTRYGCSQFHNSFLLVWTGRRIGAVSGWADIACWVETHEPAFSGLDGSYEAGTSLVMKHGPRWKNAPKWLVTESTNRGKTPTHCLHSHLHYPRRKLKSSYW
jgi:hypothetical protein